MADGTCRPKLFMTYSRHTRLSHALAPALPGHVRPWRSSSTLPAAVFCFPLIHLPILSPESVSFVLFSKQHRAS